VEENEQWIRLSNQYTGISIRKTLTQGQGPIEAIRLNSGDWVGGSQLTGHFRRRASTGAEITARGPVMAEVDCRAKFGSRPWRMRVAVHARDHVVGVYEGFSLARAPR